jgi:hypothetical protein
VLFIAGVLFSCSGSCCSRSGSKSTLTSLKNYGKRQRGTRGHLWEMRRRDRSKSSNRFHAKGWNYGL